PAKDPAADIDAEMKMLRDEESQLRQSVAGYERRMEDAPRRLREFQRQARDYAATKEFYESLVKKYEDAQMAENMEQGQKGEQFRIVDAAVAPKVPVAPSRLRLVLMGVIASLGLTAGAVMLAERIDTSFHTMDELRAFTRVPVLAGIPPLATDRDMARGRRRAVLAGASFVVGLVVVAGASYAVAR